MEHSEASLWLVTGATGHLGSHIVGILAGCCGRENSAAEVVALHSGEKSIDSGAVNSKMKFTCPVKYVAVDFADSPELWASRVEQLVTENHVTHVVHCAGITNVQRAYEHPELSRYVNVEATKALASIAAKLCKVFVYCSTDMVFDGTRLHLDYRGQCGAFYDEDECTCPLSVYGRSKAEGEIAVANVAEERSSNDNVCEMLVARCSLMFGLAYVPRELHVSSTFLSQLTKLVHPEQPCSGFTDEFRTPLSYHRAAQLILDVAVSQYAIVDRVRCPIFHIAGRTRVSRFALLEVMRDRLAHLLLSNETRLAPSGREKIVAMLTRLSVVDDDPSESPQYTSPTMSPVSVALRVADKLMDRKIDPSERDSGGGSEPRPADLSLSCDKLEALLRSVGKESHLLTTLEEDMDDALSLWLEVE